MRRTTGPTGSVPARLVVPFLGFMAGTCMADANINTTALVDAARGLGMGPALLPIASSAMSMCLAATVVSTGMLADRKGRRRILVLALVVAIGSELLTAASPAPAVFLVGRGVTGIAMGAVFSAAYATVRDVVGGPRLGAALGVFGAASGLALLVVSVLGGAMATVDWRLAYVVIPVLFTAAALAVPRLLPPVPPVGRGPVDVPGQILLAVAVVGPLLGLSQASRSLSSPVTWGPVVLGAASFVAFVLTERRRRHPFYPVRLFGDRWFIGAVMLGVGFNLSQSVLLLQLSDVLQYVKGFTTVEVSASQFPALGAGVVASVIAGRRLSAGTTDRRVGVVGFSCVVVGLLSLLVFRPDSSFWVLLPALLLVGVGAQTLQVPFSRLMVTVAPPDHYGPVTSSRLTIGQMTFAFGMAGSTVLIDRLTNGGLLHRLNEVGASPAQQREVLEAVSLYVQSGDSAVTAKARDALSFAAVSYVNAFAVTMAVMAVLLAVLGGLMWWVLRRPGTNVPQGDGVPPSGGVGERASHQ